MSLEQRLEKRYSEIYNNHQKYFLVPLALLMLAVAVLGFSYTQNGEFFQKGTDFTGGTEAQFQINGSFPTTEIEQAFSDAGKPGANAITQQTSEGKNLLVEIPPPDINQSEAEDILTDAGYQVEVLQFNSISASVSNQFFLQAQIAFVLAFTVMSLVIFIAFKDITPSMAVIFAAAGDIIIAGAGMALLGIPLTLGSLAALLMLIGYSVDTDIVLSSRTLKREKDSLQSRMWESLKTGVTMSSGGIAGFTLLYIVSYVIVGPSELSNIAAVMVIGLLADMPLTWLGNTAILKSYIEGEDLIYRGGA
ncbi:protein translocase subunit SecF [Candidatus Nanohalobium constans]|uniref:protein translocase subunit SecF n=1 Tax=Candidatus Nanohalobium constans TaxID=2565781 RepID=UPI001C3C83CF|nr:protein translocase subunit SecF [Candidatus Nanohalobium constans]